MSVRSMVSAEHEANETASAFFRMTSNSASRSSCGQPLGIVEPLGDALRVEDHRRRHDRPGQRPAAGLVEPGDRPDAARHRRASPSRNRDGSLPSRNRGGESERGRAIVRRCSHQLRFSASLRPRGSGRGGTVGCGRGTEGRTVFGRLGPRLSVGATGLLSEQHQLLAGAFGRNEQIVRAAAASPC